MTSSAAATTTPAYDGGSGPALVLLHGLHASWRAWEPVLPHLTDDFSVFAPTLPGHRGAATRPSPATVPRLADALEEQLDQQGLAQAHLVGNSLGGWLSLELGRRGRALSVVAFSPAGSWGRDKDLARLARLMRQARRAGNVRLVERLGPRVRRVALRTASERGDLITPEAWAGMLEDLRACDVLDDVLDGIREHGPMASPLVPEDVPVRIVWPERDRTIPYERYGSTLLPHLPQAELVRLKGIGHVPMHDDPELVARSIKDFVLPLTSG